MERVDTRFAGRIEEIGANRTAGASELLQAAVDVLAEALALGVRVEPIAHALGQAQPSMASLLNAGAAAIAAEQDPQRFEQFRQRLARAPRAMVRNAMVCFAPGGDAPLRLITISYSRSVRLILAALKEKGPVQVFCGEGRPALEGRMLAAELARLGVAVTLFTDAALGTVLLDADAVLVGADAVISRGVVNKVGTHTLAVAAARLGIPVYVAATRDKFLDAALGARLRIRSGNAAEVWEAAPAGIDVRNPYFEEVPLDVITAVISDSAVIPGPLVPEACER